MANWIAGAIKKPGSFTKQAKSADMSTSAYASKVTAPGSKASPTTKRRANLAQTLAGFRAKKGGAQGYAAKKGLA